MKGEVKMSLKDDYENAMNVLSELAGEYEKWVRGDLKHLMEVFEKAKSLNGNQRVQVIQSELFPIAHDVKGQGATFDYDLITQVADHLCRYIEKKSSYGPKELDDIELHIVILNKIIDAHLTGDGGESGLKLLSQIKDIS